MTLFVASLFLPYTVSFDTADSQYNGEDKKQPKHAGTNTPVDYFSVSQPLTASSAAKIPLTPGATTEIERIFIPDVKGLPFKLHLPSSQSATNLRSLVHTETYSSIWGKNEGEKQPKSRAKSPPPASILKHSATNLHSLPDGAHLRKQFRRRRATSSHDQSFSDSEFAVNLGVLGNGGLVSALDAASDHGALEEKTWVGTLGIPTDALHQHTKSEVAERLEHDFESLAVWVDDDDLNGHYEHYCKTILWPVLHYQIPDHPKSKAYEDHSWVFYVRVNQAFADRIVSKYKREDVVWIHDYHLLLVPGMVRKQLPDAQIGFYLHTAFPSSEIFRCLATRSDLLEGLLGANMIGFQIEEYANHFLQTCSRLLNVEVTKEGIILEDGRVVHVDTFPIGIDPATVDSRRAHADVQTWIDTISDKYAGKRLIVARDKLDGVRGIKQKMLAYERFLECYPEFRNDVVLIQIATSTTEDPDLTATIADIVTRINSTYSTLAHQPLVFLKQDINYSQWLALMTVADTLLVTSLREGMNLTGHVFIYCQDGLHVSGVKKHSPLIVSEFTGSAALLKDSALLVNPWDYRQCAESMKQALDMSATEKELRWSAMHNLIIKHSAIDWFRSYMDGLALAYRDHVQRDATAVPRLAFADLQRAYENASNRLLILDYEGTLAIWDSPNDIVFTTPKRAIDTLNELLDDRKNTVYVMSSRRPDEMDQIFKLVPGIGMIAENGAYLLMAGSPKWISLVDPEHVANWKVGVRSILEYYEERMERSRIEELDSALIFNYAATNDKLAAFKQAGECANHINDACLPQRVQALPIEHGLYISDADLDKSSATGIVGKILFDASREGAPLPEFLLVIGNSREDEHVFKWAQRMEDLGVRDVITVTVGQRNTVASCTLTQGVTGVLSTLQKLTGQRVPDGRKMFSAKHSSKWTE